MFDALGALLGVLNLPLNAMGEGMQLNAATYVAAGGIASKPMSTVAFAVFAGPWIQYLGNLAVAAGNFMVEMNTTLQGLTTFLSTL